MEKYVNLITLVIVAVSSLLAYIKGSADTKASQLKSNLDTLSKYDKITNKKVKKDEVYKEKKW